MYMYMPDIVIIGYKSLYCLRFTSFQYFIENHQRKTTGHSSRKSKALKKRIPSTFNLFVKDKEKTMKGRELYSPFALLTFNMTFNMTIN
jgi:hypothetical protein